MKRLFFILTACVALLVLLIGAAGVVGAMLPRRYHAVSTAHLDVPRDSVWAAIAMERSATWRTDITAVRRLPDHDGHEVWEQQDRDERWPLELTVVRPPDRLVATLADSSHGLGATWTWELEDEHDGTRVTVVEDGFIANPMVRFMANCVFGLDFIGRQYLKDLGRHFGETVSPRKG